MESDNSVLVKLKTNTLMIIVIYCYKASTMYTVITLNNITTIKLVLEYCNNLLYMF